MVNVYTLAKKNTFIKLTEISLTTEIYWNLIDSH